MKSKCRKCGRFLKASDLTYADYNIHTQCRIKEAWDQLNAIMSKGESDSPKYAFLSAFSLNPQIRDFKTGDIWEEGKKEKDAVRKYAEQRDFLDQESRRVERRTFKLTMIFMCVMGAVFGGSLSYLIWGMR